jgi:hypothetical protein
MLMVGARRQTAFRAFVSFAKSLPASSTSVVEKVAPPQVALGSAVAGAVREIESLQRTGPIQARIPMLLTHFEKTSATSSIRSFRHLDTGKQRAV